ncbi:hypothetical protein OF820_08880 [Oceanotoga sp. DSM 15011]|uniref:M42 family metallopeptidase n=1 Tax=Oceanotoga sp. DSM 15011 TaxID=2984951 RepID=UPI0021F47F13|nr:hypothetical protein [Oceanotoga sp. DSM 15011]UYO99186.1 hypothetical protein OF820_08880 [Oceanotoga sp. DSM 15011]
MLSAHFDEIGFVVKSVTNDGYIKFISIGRLLEQSLIAKRVRILTDCGEILGVVSSKPVHFVNPVDSKKMVTINDMFIDIGANNKEEVFEKFKVEVGQSIVFDSEFSEFNGEDLFVAKAFDNRLSVAMTIQVANELDKISHPNIVFCGSTVQEEVRGRGAYSASNLVNPDLAIVLEGVPADDFPGSSKEFQQGAIGKGVQIRVMDSSAIMSKRFNKFIISIAKEMSIPYQICVRESGGTDASMINTNNLGVPVVVLGVPVRYTHTANSIINIKDYFYEYDLIIEIIKRIDEDVYKNFVTY